jgi:uncharacterized protein
VKIVLDTNVLIAAFVAQGYCHELLENCVRQHTLITSDFIINEFREKLAKKFKYNSTVISDACELLLTRMIVVLPTKLESQVCRDLDDDNVIGTAITGDCDCIITGDKDLLVLKQYQNINIISPTEFRLLEDAELN